MKKTLCSDMFYLSKRADFEFVKALNQAEITMEFKLKEDRQLETEELIFEPKRLIALGRLYHSLVSSKEMDHT